MLRGISYQKYHIGSCNILSTLVYPQAMAVGAQMKIAHNLRSAEHISRKELQRVLAGSFDSAGFKVEPFQMEEMIEGIMKVK